MPWRSVSQDGVEDGDQLPSGGNQGDELGLTGCDEPVTEGFQRGVVTAGHHGPMNSAVRTGAAACDEAPPSPLTGLPRPRGQADQRGDLLSVEASKLGQLRDQGSCDRRSNTRNGGQEGLLPAPFKRPVYLCIDRAVDHTLLLLQRLYDAPDAVSNARWDLTGWLWAGLIERISLDQRSWE